MHITFWSKDQEGRDRLVAVDIYEGFLVTAQLDAQIIFNVFIYL